MHPPLHCCNRHGVRTVSLCHTCCPSWSHASQPTAGLLAAANAIPFFLNPHHFSCSTFLTPRLRVQFLSKLVNLQGIVTRCTLVRPKIVKSVHW